MRVLRRGCKRPRLGLPALRYCPADARLGVHGKHYPARCTAGTRAAPRRGLSHVLGRAARRAPRRCRPPPRRARWRAVRIGARADAGDRSADRRRGAWPRHYNRPQVLRLHDRWRARSGHGRRRPGDWLGSVRVRRGGVARRARWSKRSWAAGSSRCSGSPRTHRSAWSAAGKPEIPSRSRQRAITCSRRPAGTSSAMA
jgi:hypothetical protein